MTIQWHYISEANIVFIFNDMYQTSFNVNSKIVFFFFRMSDINKKSYYSKLRNNEMSKCDSQSKSNYYYQTFGSQMVDLESSNVPKKNTDQQV